MSRSASTWVLLLVAALIVAIATFVVITTALGFAHADVRGHRLTGALEALFLTGLAIAVLTASAAAFGLWHRRAWSVYALAATWPAFALICLVLDRITPAPGPGRPWWFYLAVGLLPAVVTVLLACGQRADERLSGPHSVANT